MGDITVSKKRIKEKANLDPKTKAVFEKKGLVVLDKISEGAFGKVYTATNSRRGEMSAVKVMDLEKCNQKFKEKFLPREISMLILIKHVNVVKVYDIFKSGGKIYIFMEFCPNGTLADIVKKGGPCPEEKTKFWFKQVNDALQFMHLEKQICHRDIKVENVLLDTNNDAKLSDFGFARELVVNGEIVLSSTYCGTEPYYCPELVNKRDNPSTKLQYEPFKADTFAMGVMLFAMLNNKFPYHYDKRQYQEQVTHGYKYRSEVEWKLSGEAKDLIRRLLEVNPSIRYDTLQTSQHPWMI